MATVAGSIKGIVLKDPYAGTGRHVAEVFCTFTAYSAGSDTFIVSSVDTAIENSRRDGKTVTLKDVTQGQTGAHGGTEFFLGTLAVSTNDITGELENSSGTEIDADNGVSERAGSFLVSYLLA